MSGLRHKHRRAAQKKHTRTASLNLVALMDIFTILVFFLMVNSSEVQVLQTSSQIKLPESTSANMPKNQLIISVNHDDIIVQGRPVAKVAELEGKTLIIEGLEEELTYQASRKAEIPEGGFEITIMGDKEIPYWLLKKIMYTCQMTDFARIALAVNQKIDKADGSDGAGKS